MDNRAVRQAVHPGRSCGRLPLAPAPRRVFQETIHGDDVIRQPAILLSMYRTLKD